MAGSGNESGSEFQTVGPAIEKARVEDRGEIGEEEMDGKQEDFPSMKSHRRLRSSE